MLKGKVCLAIILLIVISSSANAITIRADASPKISADTILGGSFFIDIYINFDGNPDIYATNIPFYLYSPDNSIININHNDLGGAGETGSIILLNGFENNTIFNMATIVELFSYEDALPDTISYVGLGISNAPSDLGEQLYIRIALNAEEEGMLCIDSTDQFEHNAGNYDWIFSSNSGMADVPFNGPYCWYITNGGCVDTDGDGIFDSGGDNCNMDNCPDTYNPMQTDIDMDGLGDECDPCPTDTTNDIDEDGVCGSVDNCPGTYNPLQEDTDSDGIGNACDDCPEDADNDIDGDGYCANEDNCPDLYNPLQEDVNQNGIGDLCENRPCADLNGDYKENILDIIYLIYYLYSGGTPPVDCR